MIYPSLRCSADISAFQYDNIRDRRNIFKTISQHTAVIVLKGLDAMATPYLPTPTSAVAPKFLRCRWAISKLRGLDTSQL